MNEIPTFKKMSTRELVSFHSRLRYARKVNLFARSVLGVGMVLWAGTTVVVIFLMFFGILPPTATFISTVVIYAAINYAESSMERLRMRYKELMFVYDELAHVIIDRHAIEVARSKGHKA